MPGGGGRRVGKKRETSPGFGSNPGSPTLTNLSGHHQAAQLSVPQSPCLLMDFPAPFCKESENQRLSDLLSCPHVPLLAPSLRGTSPLMFTFWTPDPPQSSPRPPPPTHLLTGHRLQACVCELTRNHGTRAFLSAVMKPFNHIQIGYCSGGK